MNTREEKRDKRAKLNTDTTDQPPLLQELQDVGPLEHHETPIESVLRVPALRDEKVSQTRVRQGPADCKAIPLSELLFDCFDFLHQLALGEAVDVAGLDGVHRRSAEEPDRLVDVRLGDLGAELDLGERLGNTNDGFQLTG